MVIRYSLAVVACSVAASFLLVACGGSSSDPEYAGSGSSDRAGEIRACEKVKGIARVCHEESNAGITCSEMRATMVNEAAKLELKPKLQIQLGGLCEAACNQRKQGVSWAEISASIDCNDPG